MATTIALLFTFFLGIFITTILNRLGRFNQKRRQMMNQSRLENQQVDYMNFYDAENNPEQITHFVRTGTKDDEGNFLYLVFHEDAHEMEPWHSGIKKMSIKDIETIYKIKIK